jgi:WD40 repeat protein
MHLPALLSFLPPPLTSHPTGHTKSVLALVVDEPSSRLYTSSADATVRAWDLTDMSCVAVIRGHSKPVTKLQLLAGRLLFTAAGGAVRVWDTHTFTCLAKVKTSHYSGAIRSMLVSTRVAWVCCHGEVVLGGSACCFLQWSPTAVALLS